MAATGNKRNAYTIDFKIKVLDHYLKQGGESVFGLKAKTALHFNIGKKTVHRIVENKNALLKAKAIRSKKAISASQAKHATSGLSNKSSSNKVANAGKYPSAGNISDASAGTIKTTANKAASGLLGSKSVVISIAKSNVELAAINQSAKNNHLKTTRPKLIPSCKSYAAAIASKDTSKDITEEIEEVVDLPEDPDYSVLKLPIDGGGTGTGVAGPALLLTTATEEVRHALIHECDVLYECKVCRNLFRSVVNFLAHKRIFCTQSYNRNRKLYPEDSSCSSPHSSTVFSENGKGTHSKLRLTSRQRAAMQASSATDSGSSEYYDRLEAFEKNRQESSKDCTVVLEKIAGVTNAVYQTISHPDAMDTTEPEAQLLQTKELIMSDDKGVTAILNEDGVITRTINMRDGSCVSTVEAPAVSLLEQPYEQSSSDVLSAENTLENCIQDELALKLEVQNEKQADEEEEEDNAGKEDDEQAEASNEEKEGTFVCTECGRIFAGRKYLRVHIKNVHSPERSIFTCPICDSKFLSMWTTGKHLQRTHKKTKSQIEHLRNTIKKNSYKQVNTVLHPGRKARPTEVCDISNNNNENHDRGCSALDMSGDVKEEGDSDEALFDDITLKDSQESASSILLSSPTSSLSSSGVKSGELKQVPQRSLPRCPNCAMFFVSERSLQSHLLLYCHNSNSSITGAPHYSTAASALRNTHQGKDTLLNLKHSPAKKIGIQIRKVYKTEDDRDGVLDSMGIGISPNSDNRLSTVISPVRLKVVNRGDAIADRKARRASTCSNSDRSEPSSGNSVLSLSREGPVPATTVNSLVNTFCNLKKLKCNLCHKKFSNSTNTKRHAAIHMSWTRFECSFCGFRHYSECNLVEHLLKEHHVGSSDIEMYYDEVHFLNEPFKTVLSKLNFEENETVETQDNKDLSIILVDAPGSDDNVVNDKNVPDYDKEQSSKSVLKEVTKECAPAELLQLSPELDKNGLSEKKEIKYLQKSPQTLTLKLKRVHIESLDKSTLDVKTKSTSPLKKTKSLESIIKTITIGSKSVGVSPVLTKESQETASLPTCRCDVTNSNTPVQTTYNVASSRARRVIRPPVKRKYPDSPPTFTGVLKKRDAEVNNLKHTVSDKDNSKPAVKKLRLSVSESVEKKTPDKKVDSSSKGCHKKLKINISSLTKKAVENVLASSAVPAVVGGASEVKKRGNHSETADGSTRESKLNSAAGSRVEGKSSLLNVMKETFNCSTSKQ